MAVTEKLEEKKLQKKQNGKAVLRAIHTAVKTMEEGDERKMEEQKLQILLGTLQKYDQMFNGFNHDDTMFLRVSQVFKAEYDSRVTFPHEISELENEYEAIEEALDEVIDRAGRAKKERTKNRVKHKRESVHKKKEEEQTIDTKKDGRGGTYDVIVPSPVTSPNSLSDSWGVTLATVTEAEAISSGNSFSASFAAESIDKHHVLSAMTPSSSDATSSYPTTRYEPKHPSGPP